MSGSELFWIGSMVFLAAANSDKKFCLWFGALLFVCSVVLRFAVEK